MADEQRVIAEEVRVYRAWLLAEVTSPQWYVGHPSAFNGLPDDWMWGTCFNDDCLTGIIELKDVARWRKHSREGMVTFSGVCRPCVADLLRDYSLGKLAERHIDGLVTPNERGGSVEA